MDRNIQKNGLINLLALLAVGVAGFVVARLTNSESAMVAVIYAAANAGKADYTISMAGKKIAFAMPSDGWATVKVK